VTLTVVCAHLRESMKRGVYVDGLSEHIVSSAKEAYQVKIDKFHYILAINTLAI